ncbi:MAG: DUF1178 family protein [Pseudomonadota bacterium]
MIKYTLKCQHGHAFESWFECAEAFDKLQIAGLIECGLCGSTDVEKTLMAPQVKTAKGRPDLIKPISEIEKEIAQLRKKVESNAEDVGKNFAKEARAMYYGDKPERAIYGQAKPEEAKSLTEEGVPVAPLPWGPKTTN